MTEPMIRHVARAMWSKAKEEPIRRGIGVSFENDPMLLWWMDQARVALEAMREPTRAMHDAGLETTGMPSNTFRDMIDAALKE